MSNEVEPLRISGLILAGGRSSRMGRDKALLTVPEGVTLLDRAVQTLREAGATEIIVSTVPGRSYWLPGTREVVDGESDCGPLAGLSAGLEAATGDYVVVLAVDLPLMTAAYLRELLGVARRQGAGVVPSGATGLEPLAAVYPRRAAECAREALQQRTLSLQNWVQTLVERKLVTLRTIAEADRALFANWNTPQDCA